MMQQNNRMGGMGAGMGGSRPDKTRSELLCRLQAVDFALYETILYLDAYPNNRKALTFYQARQKEAETLRAEYERCFGPLTAKSNASCDTWQWTQGPWPWEKEAN